MRLNRVKNDESVMLRSPAIFPVLIPAVLFFAGCAVSPIAKFDYRAEYETCRAAAQSGTCHLHHVAMSKKVVPINYGLPSEVESGPSQDVRLKQFPFTGRSPEGGCAIEADAPRTMEVSVCPECVAAEKRWMKLHPQRS
jgi:hypothetical protein